MSGEMSSSPRFLPLPAALSMNISLIWPPLFSLYFFFLWRSFTATSRRFLIALDQFLPFAREWKQRHVAVWLFWSDPVKKGNRQWMDLIGTHRCFKRCLALRCSALYFTRARRPAGALREEGRNCHKASFCFRLHFKLDFISGTTTMAPKKVIFGCLKVSVHESIYSCLLFSPFFSQYLWNQQGTFQFLFSLNWSGFTSRCFLLLQ